MDRKQLIKAYIDFYKSKGHKEIPNSSLIPVNNPSVLFTTAGMHPIIPYLLGQAHPLGKRLVNVQRCIRTQDIDDVGDSYHHTFFEMLGNWSVGDYFKKEAIEFSFEFFTKVLKIPLERFAVTCFAGDKTAEKDNEAAKVWLKLGISKDRIAFLGKEDNWWETPGPGPCGPDTEMFYWKLNNKPAPKVFDPKDKNWVEIGNDVLMQYEKTKRTLLVDGMHCLYDKEFNINKELLEIVNSFGARKILVVNGFKEKAEKLVKSYGFEVFSLEGEKINKDNAEFFKKLIKKCNLNIDELLYFDHLKENIDSAKKLGITSELYKDNNQIKKLIEQNLFGYKEAKQKNIDFGGGVERIVAVLSGLEDDYLAPYFFPIIKQIEKLSNKSYKSNEISMRIIADHIKASVFIIADGIIPSNTEQGYVLRRLIRRAIRHGKKLNLSNFTKQIAIPVFDIYDDYEILKKNKENIINELEKEEKRFLETLENGMREFERILNENKKKKTKEISGKQAFLLYQSYGFPLEITKELAKEKNIKINEKEFEKELEAHQELSRTAMQGKFKSGLQDNSEQTKRLHTATHLLLASLKKVMKTDIKQKGSNITPERLRFDFSFDRKLTEKEIREVEKLVNQKIIEGIPIVCETMSPQEAKKNGATGVFEDKYGDKVTVYSAGTFSKEICAGPHVQNTNELGTFKILKEEASSAGVRRIKAVLE